LPRYAYKCSDCEKTFTVFHSMGDSLDNCVSCKGHVQRIPSLQYTFSSSSNVAENVDVANKVSKHIEEAKKELDKTKKQSREDYK